MRLRPHPSVAHLRAMLKNLPDKTGKGLDEWAKIAQATGESDVNAAAVKLKAEYGLGKPTAWLIASHGLKANMADYDEAAYLAKAPMMVDAQYEGKKGHLRPICDRLIYLAEGLGSDVAASPCKTYVPLYKKHVFAQIKAATQKRVDLGLALKSYDGTIDSILKDTGGTAKGDRITHVIGITSLEEIDDHVALWLKRAYELDQ